MILKNKKIYQTLEDRGNVDEIERNGPFFCNWRNSWLGNGYYFWDSFIENAHWWGSVHRGGKYIICEALVDLTPLNCFDLVGNTTHLIEFEQCINFMKERGLHIPQNTTVSRIIQFMQKNNIFVYSAIRAHGVNSKSKDFIPNHRIGFELGLKYSYQYLQYKPEIQICILKSKISNLNFREYRVIYPDVYNPEYVI